MYTYMLTISRMKSLVSRAFPTTTPSSIFPLASKPIFPNPTSLHYPHSLPFRPTIFSPKSSISTVQSRRFQVQASTPSSGEVHVIVGPMFAGKTTTLLQRCQSESISGRNVAIIKSSKDTRYSLDSIVTHDGAKLPCQALTDLSSFREKFGLDAYDKLDVIGIDEAQFFGDLYDFCREAADHDCKTVIVAGLDGDYLRRSFGSVLDIIPLADSVTKLSARCELCGKRALFTLRKTEEKRREVIGGADVYMPVCRHHYVSGQAVIEAARTVIESDKVQCGTYL